MQVRTCWDSKIYMVKNFTISDPGLRAVSSNGSPGWTVCFSLVWGGVYDSGFLKEGGWYLSRTGPKMVTFSSNPRSRTALFCHRRWVSRRHSSSCWAGHVRTRMQQAAAKTRCSSFWWVRNFHGLYTQEHVTYQVRLRAREIEPTFLLTDVITVQL